MLSQTKSSATHSASYGPLTRAPTLPHLRPSHVPDCANCPCEGGKGITADDVKEERERCLLELKFINRREKSKNLGEILNVLKVIGITNDINL